MSDYNEAEYAASLDIEDLYEILDGGVAEAVDGCQVEPDGKCPHGFSSPLLILGMM